MKLYIYALVVILWLIIIGSTYVLLLKLDEAEEKINHLELSLLQKEEEVARLNTELNTSVKSCEDMLKMVRDGQIKIRAAVNAVKDGNLSMQLNRMRL